MGGVCRYPRRFFFEQVAGVIAESGRPVPVFTDKHFAYDFTDAQWMWDRAAELSIPLMAGSCLPLAWRRPWLEHPKEQEVISEALAVGYGRGGDVGTKGGSFEAYGFHTLETLQCMVERRKGGETGIEWLQAYRGDAFWDALYNGVWSRKLMDAALCRSHTLTPAREGFNHVFPTVDEMKSLVEDPVAYVYGHSDGLQCAMLLMRGLVQDFNFSARMGDGSTLSTQMYLPMPPARTTLASFFTPLVNNVEQMFLTGEETYPLERTLVTTGLTAAGVESLYQASARIETPHLRIQYSAPEQSTFWRT